MLNSNLTYRVALLASLVITLDGMESAPLSLEYVQHVPDAQGVYQLLIGEKVVYIGKTDADAGLAKRLRRHSLVIQHRKNLNAADIRFKAVRVFVFTAMDLETQLIRHYGTPEWNNSGFGSNDPGRNRDATELKPTGFDARYPIDLDQTIPLDVKAGTTVARMLYELKAALPYTFRFETTNNWRSPHPELENAILTEDISGMVTTRSAILAALARLPAGWQATLLAGRIILYRENREYASGTLIGYSAANV